MMLSVRIRQILLINKTTFLDILIIPVLATSLAIMIGLLLLLITGENYQIALRALIALFVGCPKCCKRGDKAPYSLLAV